jgi:predicted acyltransferase
MPQANEKSNNKNIPPTAPVEATTSQRILSIDALRGFDMFWIIGGGAFVASFLPLFGQDAVRILKPQLEHVAWEGFRFYDLIFPLFVFIVGITTVLSLAKTLEQHGKRAAYIRLIRRSVLLFLLGIFYYGGAANTWPNIRLLGVLQRIALCYLATGVLCIHFRLRGIIIVLVAILAGYWALLSFVPLPGAETVSFDEGKNWACYIDAKFLPGKKHYGQWDPEGILSTLPAIATCLLGVLAAYMLRSQKLSTTLRVLSLFGAGILCLAGGYAWGLQFPIIKKIWTSSYVLVAGGYSFILLAVFYTVIDVWKLQRWAIPFVWIGANAITLYIGISIVDFRGVASRIVGGNIQTALGPTIGNFALYAVAFALLLTLAAFLYRRKIFLRI